MVINTNVSSLVSRRILGESTAQLSKSLARLSAGSRIISPQDDAAGLAQSLKLTAQVHRNKAASDNIANAISYSQTQDGELKKMQKAVDRYNELTMLALDVTKTAEDVQYYENEAMTIFSHAVSSLNQTFNDVPLFQTSSLDVTIDSDGNVFQMPGIDLGTALSSIFGPGGTAGTIQDVGYAIDAVQGLAAARAQVGANIARLNMTNETLSILNENLAAANSRIADVDVAEESTTLARYNILTQSGTAMLAHANLLPQSVLRLLG